MGKKQLARVSVVREFEKVSDAIKGLESFAVAFPDSRGEVMDLIEHSSDQGRRYGRALKNAADRIAAIEMLEILHSE